MAQGVTSHTPSIVLPIKVFTSTCVADDVNVALCFEKESLFITHHQKVDIINFFFEIINT